MTNVVSLINKRAGADLIQASIQTESERILIRTHNALSILEILKSDPDANFDILSDLSAIEHSSPNITCDFWSQLEAPVPSPFLEVYYLLRSSKMHTLLSLSILVSGPHPHILSVGQLYSNAIFLERELFDMFGIRAEGEVQPRRLLTYPGFRGYPLREKS